MEPVIAGLLHLPAQTAGIFLLGFLRRDYGAAGFYNLGERRVADRQQVVVSMNCDHAFCSLPGQFFYDDQGGRERRKALAIAGFIVPFAISVGAVVSWILRTFDIQFN